MLELFRTFYGEINSLLHNRKHLPLLTLENYHQYWDDHKVCALKPHRYRFQNQENLVPKVMAVSAVHLPRLHMVEACTNLRRNHYVTVDGSIVKDVESHVLLHLLFNLAPS